MSDERRQREVLALALLAQDHLQNEAREKGAV